MPQPKFASGPWGEAIRYWLQRKNMSPADLARATEIRPNTISRARRGFHTTTRVLDKIAAAFEISLEEVLVSPDRKTAEAERKRMIEEAVATAMREYDRRHDPRASIEADVRMREQMAAATQPHPSKKTKLHKKK